MNQSTLNRRLTQAVGIFFGMAIAVWVLRGFEILTSLPGGIILLLFGAAIVTAVITYVQKTWWRF